jgi:hypothetical protein
MAFILLTAFLPVPAVLSVPEFSAAFLPQFQFTVPYFYFVPDLANFTPL